MKIKANCSFGTSYQLMKGCVENPDLNFKKNVSLNSFITLEQLQNSILNDLTSRFENKLNENYNELIQMKNETTKNGLEKDESLQKIMRESSTENMVFVSFTEIINIDKYFKF